MAANYKSRIKKDKIYLGSHTDIAVSIIYLKVHTMDFIAYNENVLFFGQFLNFGM